MAEEMKDDKLDEAAEGGKPKKDMKGLIKIAMIAGGALAFMGLNLGVTMMVVGGKQAAPPAPMADAAAPAADAQGKPKEAAAKDASQGDGKAADGKADEASKGVAVYYAFDPAFVVNFQAQDQLRFLQVKVEAMARDQKVIEAIEKHMPVIRNNLVVLFSSQDFTTISTRVGKERLRSQTLAEVQKILKDNTGQPGVEQIYFTSFVMQ